MHVAGAMAYHVARCQHVSNTLLVVVYRFLDGAHLFGQLCPIVKQHSDADPNKKATAAGLRETFLTDPGNYRWFPNGCNSRLGGEKAQL